jgi:hypothetical protein
VTNALSGAVYAKDVTETTAPVFLLAALGLALAGCAGTDGTQSASRHVSTP